MPNKCGKMTNLRHYQFSLVKDKMLFLTFEGVKEVCNYDLLLVLHIKQLNMIFYFFID